MRLHGALNVAIGVSEKQGSGMWTSCGVSLVVDTSNKDNANSFNGQDLLERLSSRELRSAGAATTGSIAPDLAAQAASPTAFPGCFYCIYLDTHT